MAKVMNFAAEQQCCLYGTEATIRHKQGGKFVYEVNTEKCWKISRTMRIRI